VRCRKYLKSLEFESCPDVDLYKSLSPSRMD
jgi:hypothetical protein